MTYRAWQVNRPDEQAAAKLAAQIGAPKLLARVLTARGLDTPEKAMGLLGQDVPLTDPMRMKDMDKAVERILRAIDEEEKMVVFGDYDVDGVTATAPIRATGSSSRWTTEFPPGPRPSWPPSWALT